MSIRDFDDIDDMFKRIQDMMDRGFTGGYRSDNIKSKDYDVDIQEDDEYIYITMELKIQEEDLTVTPKEQSIILELMDRGAWNRKVINLPSKIDIKSAEITFNNCVLDITLHKIKEKKEENVNEKV